MQRTGKSVRFLRILNGYLPGLSVGGNAVDVHIPSQAGKAARNAAGGKQGRYTVGGVALGDAAQIDRAALVQRNIQPIKVNVFRPHQRQQRVDLLLIGNAGVIRGDPPQLHQRGNGHIKGAAGLLAVPQRAAQQFRCALIQHSAAVGVEPRHIACFDGAAELLLQRIDLIGGSLQYVKGAVSHRHQRHVGVHGEDIQRLGFRRAAGGQRQGQHRSQQQADPAFHSSRRPSSARISVASSANSRWPPTGMP